MAIFMTMLPAWTTDNVDPTASNTAKATATSPNRRDLFIIPVLLKNRG